MKDSKSKEGYTIQNGKVSDYGLFEEELSQEHEQTFDEKMYAIKLNRAAKAEIRRREAEKKVNDILDHLFDEYI